MRVKILHLFCAKSTLVKCQHSVSHTQSTHIKYVGRAPHKRFVHTRRFFTSPEHEHTAAKKNRYQRWMQWPYSVRSGGKYQNTNAVCTTIIWSNVNWNLCAFVRGLLAIHFRRMLLLLLFSPPFRSCAMPGYIFPPLNFELHMNEISWFWAVDSKVDGWMDGWMHAWMLCHVRDTMPVLLCMPNTHDV